MVRGLERWGLTTESPPGFPADVVEFLERLALLIHPPRIHDPKVTGLRGGNSTYVVSEDGSNLRQILQNGEGVLGGGSIWTPSGNITFVSGPFLAAADRACRRSIRFITCLGSRRRCSC